MSRLDAQAFPHIWELIESYASHKLLLRLRLVYRASCVKATRALFSHVEIRAQSRTTEGNPAFAFSFGDGPLPLQPSRMMGPVDLPEHTGWEDTRVLDVRVNIHDVQPYLIGLEVVRRYPGVCLAPPAFTYVDVIRAPFVGRARVHPTGYLTERHVFVVLYDVAAPTDPTVHLTFPQAPAGEDAVFVFRSSVLAEPTPSRMPRSEQAETFLRTIFCFVAQSSHASYTLVGLENVPPSPLLWSLGWTQTTQSIVRKCDPKVGPRSSLTMLCVTSTLWALIKTSPWSTSGCSPCAVSALKLETRHGSVRQ